MKILFTGGGSGGHFYPIIAVAESINKIAKAEHLLDAKLYYMAPTPYNPRALLENNITFIQNPAGKLRRYFSLLNITDTFKTGWGILVAIVKVFSIFPDVIFSKGGYASFPALVAGRLFKIPVVIHESDCEPGRVNAWAGKFATRIAISYPEAAHFFPEEKTAYTSNPIRKEILIPSTDGAYAFLKLEENTPTIAILGGSQGAAKINEILLQSLPDLVPFCQIIHQTGKLNFTPVKETATIVLQNNPQAGRYHPFEYLDTVTLKMVAGVSNLIISRAGSSIFEIAIWGVPSIIIPIPEAISHDQHKNAFAYSRTGAATVIEEENLSPHVLTSEIKRLIQNPELLAKMKQATVGFARKDASDIIAKEIIKIALEHDK
ncbi:MAG: hypothetical protein RLZZ347_825 [Candidatus Parcubacteria bacterium]|jgi:UDP-N-acetylglucosamine--N-acetylmuramyl-(pentapeptide) pyrophosphoryl-undecaprenol N-acetylglucosamine transferase